MKENEIHIKCRLCNQFHEYEFHPDRFNGLSAQWKTIGNPDLLMENRPKVGGSYILTLQSSLRLTINQPFWVLFQNPYSTLNGIETAEDLSDLLFCKCEFKTVHSHNDFMADIEITVIEIKELDSLKEEHKPAISWWTLFTDYHISKGNGRTENFKNYSVISINVQSDLGIDLIVKKENGTSRIIAVNDWDFHLNEWNLCNIKMTREDEEKYGIQVI